MFAGKLYVLRDARLEPVSVKLGISDGRFTEISSDRLKTGDRVVVGETQEEGDVPASSTSNMRFRMF